MIGGGAIGGGTTEILKDVGSNVLGKVGKKLVEDGVDMALDLTQTATENGGLTGKDVLFSAVTSFGGDLVGAAKTNSTARNQLIDAELKSKIVQIMNSTDKNSKYYNDLKWFSNINYTTTTEYFGELKLFLLDIVNLDEFKHYKSDLLDIINQISQILN